jgi:DNA-binding response OmpR family regulator
VVDALRTAGHRPFEAGRADEGQRLALERDFDLLLLDLGRVQEMHLDHSKVRNCRIMAT